MFSSDSWLSNLDSTLFQGCWFKCKYKIVPNAAKKIWVASQLKQGFWFWFFFFSTCANRTFHADLFPLLAPRGECFWSWVLFVPSPWGGMVSNGCFFPVCWLGRTVQRVDLGRISPGGLVQPATWCATRWGGAVLSTKTDWTRKGKKSLCDLYPRRRKQCCTPPCFLNSS